MSAGPAPRSRPGTVIGVLASGGILVSLLQTIVVPLLPVFPGLLDTTPATVAWLVTATLIAGAVCAPVFGRLGDLYGRRRVLLVALGLVVVGSALGAAAPDVGLLLVARVLQGASLGVVPLGLSIMRELLPEDRVGSGVALMSSSLGIGGAIGLPICGLVAQQASWRWLFGGAAALGLVLLVVVRRVVPESATRATGRFDLVGALGLAAALVCLMLAISKGAEWGWTSPLTLTLLAAAVLILLGWGRLELRRRSPLVDLRVSARPAVLLTNLASVLVGFAMFTAFVMSSQILQAPVATGYGLGLSLVVSGLVLLPIGGAMSVFSPLSARLSRRRGPRLTLVLGSVGLAAGNLLFALLVPGVGTVMLLATLLSVGAALAYSALPMIIMSAVPETDTAAANSLNALMRMLGTTSCSGVVAASVTAHAVLVDGVLLPSADAFTVVFLIGAVAALAAAALAAATPAPERAVGSDRSPLAVPAR